ncbi:hypothetical protein [Blattabacterium cuenoti]|uniref:hypothetical protein n=1 Tax=Blattabacterium cuenoti TaxID=1653831 RepID=UPI001EEB9AE5|nr:hypothetical protein [Blattabacterium cuenoti]
MIKMHNFNAGLSVLPNEVFKKSTEYILNFNHSGLSLLEISHLSIDFLDLKDKTINLIRSILNIEYRLR